jgi:hypothetical protein
MTYLNTQKLLDAIATRLQDNSPTMRGYLLQWLNETMTAVADAKVFSPPWQFLQATVENTPIVDSKVALPTDFKQVVYLKQPNGFILTANDYLTDEEAFLAGRLGFTLTKTSVVFHPEAAGTVDFRYVREVPTYQENTSNTLFPKAFENVLIRGTLARYYEADAEEHARFATAPQEYITALRQLIRQDNACRPVPKRNRRGYIRERV